VKGCPNRPSRSPRGLTEKTRPPRSGSDAKYSMLEFEGAEARCVLVNCDEEEDGDEVEGTEEDRGARSVLSGMNELSLGRSKSTRTLLGVLLPLLFNEADVQKGRWWSPGEVAEMEVEEEEAEAVEQSSSREARTQVAPTSPPLSGARLRQPLRDMAWTWRSHLWGDLGRPEATIAGFGATSGHGGVRECERV